MTPADIIDKLNKISAGMAINNIVPNSLIAEIIVKLSYPVLLPIECCNNKKCWCHTWEHIDADE